MNHTLPCKVLLNHQVEAEMTKNSVLFCRCTLSQYTCELDLFVQYGIVLVRLVYT